MTKKHFAYDFELEAPNQISLDYSCEEDEKMSSTIENGVPFLYLNKSGMITLARALIKMASGNHQPGFHVHLNKDFNADLPECLTVLLAADDTEQESAGPIG
jgi:hypothetical protein